ncbi:crotonobetaine/carnitine-CoA ligase [Saccharopolyspora antimicrobica]|uniref:Crotonobetaine/carnitine-CoA ligase n=1 Tax=Saccharopolyspora antimicrobica TaxID=455193 RepID=A0A1I5LXS7_9PSEU|nr:AMP-binding protein [Saccharopolyspora antimicrobica]RKT89055.1 crotonobetaine/carnitine-CoA ligase [Saccharopolyspora antimicrobica]SFP02040.1 crotonobetaine/carnitine-CoA ligase [Saccharopolyspora antimicrobica]
MERAGDGRAAAGSITGMLADRTARTPDAVFLRTAEGELTYAQVQSLAASTAGGLAALGAREGTPVVLLLRNSLDHVVVWFALARLGALHVPVNTALPGSRLRHVLAVSGARIVVAEADLLAQLDESLLEGRTVIVRPSAGAGSGEHVVELSEVMGSPVDAPPPRGGDLDPATLMFTSGTTGPSKACVLPHRYLARQGQIHAQRFGYRDDDVLYCPFPLFHIDAATLTVVAALAAGATAALGARFSASGFWSEVRQFDASVFNFMGATLTILWKQEPSAADRQHRVRLAWGVPVPEWRDRWQQRFGFPVYQVYGLTDAGLPVYDPVGGELRPGTCGRVIDEYDVRIDTADGAGIGEILVRGNEPGLTMIGYHGMPEATAAAIDERGWVRTGDLGSLDRDGYLVFHGRLSDSIRRRGENISAHEVEELVCGHPEVVEAAAIGVPSELTEEEVKVCVVRRAGSELSAEALHRYCLEHGARFMVPRYIEFVAGLPKTPTEKVEKFRLAQAGITDRTWDGETSR